MSNPQPMTQLAVTNYGERSLTAVEIRAQVNLIQDVMRSVMIEGTHFGVIPGTQTHSLYKAGAEKLLSTFRLAAIPEVEDLGQRGEAHYRVVVKVYTPAGTLVGAGIGECSSQEDKYAWRRPVCPEEFELTPEDRRRIKFAKGQGGKVYKNEQVRTNPADVRNTVLKMAKKRALVDAVLTVTAASDCFTQDIEDLPDELREEIAEAAGRTVSPGARAVQSTQPEDTPERRATINELEHIAQAGPAALAKKWEAIGKDKRAMVGVAELTRIKAIAEAANVIEGEAVEVQA